jgi:hypothetical protein
LAAEKVWFRLEESKLVVWPTVSVQSGIIILCQVNDPFAMGLEKVLRNPSSTPSIISLNQ